MGILLYSTIAGPVFDQYPVWTIEMGEFVMTAYYLLGGGYSMKHEGHVRMDVLYSRWSTRTRAIVDSVTDILMILFLTVLLIGGISSASYAIKYNQHNYSAWSPPMAPIKLIMVAGIVLMLLQATSILIKDLKTAHSGDGA